MKNYLYTLLLILLFSSCDNCPEEGDFAPAGMELSISGFSGWGERRVVLDYEGNEKTLVVTTGEAAGLGKLGTKGTRMFWACLDDYTNPSYLYIKNLEENYSGTPNYGEVTVYYVDYPEYSVTVKVTQEAFDPSSVRGVTILNPEVCANLTKYAGSFTLQYQAETICDHSRYETGDFVLYERGTFSSKKLRGESTFSYTANNTGKDRYGTVRLWLRSDNSQYVTIQVHQKP